MKQWDAEANSELAQSYPGSFPAQRSSLGDFDAELHKTASIPSSLLYWKDPCTNHTDQIEITSPQ